MCVFKNSKITITVSLKKKEGEHAYESPCIIQLLYYYTYIIFILWNSASASTPRSGHTPHVIRSFLSTPRHNHLRATNAVRVFRCYAAHSGRAVHSFRRLRSSRPLLLLLGHTF